MSHDKETGFNCADERRGGWRPLPRPLLRGPGGVDGGSGGSHGLIIRLWRPIARGGRRAAGGAATTGPTGAARKREQTARRRTASLLTRLHGTEATHTNRLHATLKFRNRRLSRVQLACTYGPPDNTCGGRRSTVDAAATRRARDMGALTQSASRVHLFQTDRQNIFIKRLLLKSKLLGQ